MEEGQSSERLRLNISRMLSIFSKGPNFSEALKWSPISQNILVGSTEYIAVVSSQALTDCIPADAPLPSQSWMKCVLKIDDLPPFIVAKDSHLDSGSDADLKARSAPSKSPSGRAPPPKRHHGEGPNEALSDRLQCPTNDVISDLLKKHFSPAFRIFVAAEWFPWDVSLSSQKLSSDQNASERTVDFGNDEMIVAVTSDGSVTFWALESTHWTMGKSFPQTPRLICNLMDGLKEALLMLNHDGRRSVPSEMELEANLVLHRFFCLKQRSNGKVPHCSHFSEASERGEIPLIQYMQYMGLPAFSNLSVKLLPSAISFQMAPCADEDHSNCIYAGTLCIVALHSAFIVWRIQPDDKAQTLHTNCLGAAHLPEPSVGCDSDSQNKGFAFSGFKYPSVKITALENSNFTFIRKDRKSKVKTSSKHEHACLAEGFFVVYVGSSIGDIYAYPIFLRFCRSASKSQMHPSSPLNVIPCFLPPVLVISSQLQHPISQICIASAINGFIGHTEDNDGTLTVSDTACTVASACRWTVAASSGTSVHFAILSDVVFPVKGEGRHEGDSDFFNNVKFTHWNPKMSVDSDDIFKPSHLSSIISMVMVPPSFLLANLAHDCLPSFGLGNSRPFSSIPLAGVLSLDSFGGLVGWILISTKNETKENLSNQNRMGDQRINPSKYVSTHMPLLHVCQTPLLLDVEFSSSLGFVGGLSQQSLQLRDVEHKSVPSSVKRNMHHDKIFKGITVSPCQSLCAVIATTHSTAEISFGVAPVFPLTALIGNLISQLLKLFNPCQNVSNCDKLTGLVGWQRGSRRLTLRVWDTRQTVHGPLYFPRTATPLERNGDSTDEGPENIDMGCSCVDEVGQGHIQCNRNGSAHKSPKESKKVVSVVSTSFRRKLRQFRLLSSREEVITDNTSHSKSNNTSEVVVLNLRHCPNPPDAEIENRLFVTLTKYYSDLILDGFQVSQKEDNPRKEPQQKEASPNEKFCILRDFGLCAASLLAEIDQKCTLQSLGKYLQNVGTKATADVRESEGATQNKTEANNDSSLKNAIVSTVILRDFETLCRFLRDIILYFGCQTRESRRDDLPVKCLLYSRSKALPSFAEPTALDALIPLQVLWVLWTVAYSHRQNFGASIYRCDVEKQLHLRNRIHDDSLTPAMVDDIEFTRQFLYQFWTASQTIVSRKFALPEFSTQDSTAQTSWRFLTQLLNSEFKSAIFHACPDCDSEMESNKTFTEFRCLKDSQHRYPLCALTFLPIIRQEPVNVCSFCCTTFYIPEDFFPWLPVSLNYRRCPFCCTDAPFNM